MYIMQDEITTARQVIHPLKAKYKVMSYVHNAGRNHNSKIGNTSFEREEQLKNFGETVTKQNTLREEIESVQAVAGT